MDEKRLREIYGPPKEKAASKILDKLDKHCISFIENSSFVVIGTLNGQNIDLSPKGDPSGFVKVIGKDCLEIPDRPGNNRIDGLLNIVKKRRAIYPNVIATSSKVKLGIEDVKSQIASLIE